MFILYGIIAALAMGFAVWMSATRLCEPPLDGRGRLICTVAAAVLGMVVGILRGYGGVYAPYIFRLTIALSCMAGATVCDYREKKIPNLFPALMLVAFLIAGALDWIFIPENGFASYTGGLISGGALALVLALFRNVCLFLFHQAGLGLGDLKLLAALACLVGLYGAVGTLLLGQIAAFVFASGLLIMGRAHMKDTIPFAPFLFGGLTASALLGVF